MIGVLLVDDEDYTRDGIFEGLPWEKMGISTIVQAKHGLDALEKVNSFIPNILITDVRMPQMNGIDLAYKIQALNPACFIIFMSGYSDKEYLKSAIDLKAVNYIEKPLDLEELQVAIEKSVQLIEGNKKRERIYRNSKPFVQNDFVLKLTKANSEKNELIEILHDFYPTTPVDSTCITLILKLVPKDPFSPIPLNMSEQLPNEIVSNMLNDIGFYGFIGDKDLHYKLIHLCFKAETLVELDETQLAPLHQKLAEMINPSFSLYLAMGQKVSGIFNIHSSYNTAVIVLQRLFFKPNKPILTIVPANTSTFTFNDEYLKEFSEFIATKNKSEAVFFVKKLSASMRSCEQTLEKYIRDVYFKLLLELIKLRTLTSSPDHMDYLWDYISKFDYMLQIEEFVLQKIDAYFNQFDKNQSTNLICAEILEYIHTNYNDANLSLTQISQVTFLSPPYICVVFKKETGKTLIQYITDYRIMQSIDLLKNKVLKVSDIASRVGFNDGNYYSKAFKKIKGLNPSKYREQYFHG